jgi:hypothetical protein
MRRRPVSSARPFLVKNVARYLNNPHLSEASAIVTGDAEFFTRAFRNIMMIMLADYPAAAVFCRFVRG